MNWGSLLQAPAASPLQDPRSHPCFPAQEASSSMVLHRAGHGHGRTKELDTTSTRDDLADEARSARRCGQAKVQDFAGRIAQTPTTLGKTQW